jgi:hypothetical protein
VFAVAFGVRLIWAAIVPPWLSPDEFAHFSYISHLVENGRIPNEQAPDTRYPPFTPEGDALCAATFCSDLSTLGTAPGHPTKRQALPMEHDYTRAREFALPVAQRKTSGAGPGSNYPPLYYLYGAAFYRMAHAAPVVDRMFAVRAATACLSALSAVFAYLFAFELRRDHAWGRCLGLCVALMPMHAFIGASMNNDGAFFAATAALCWLFVRVWLVSGVTLQLAACLGVVSGLALLSKATSVPVVLLAMLVFAVRLIRDARQKPPFLRLALQRIGAFSVGLLLTEGPWLLFRRLSSVAAKPTAAPGLSMVDALLGRGPYSLAQYMQDLQSRGSEYYYWLFVRSHWGHFGWLEVDMPAQVNSAICWALAIGFVGWCVRLLLNRDERWFGVFLVFAIVFNVFLLFLAADFANSFALRGMPFGMQGRYFFGMLIPLLYIVVAGFSVWSRSLAFVLRLMPLGMLLVQAAALGEILRRYYAIGML